MSSFCLNNGFRLHKTNRAARRWKQPPKKPIYHVSRDKILHDLWSILAALARNLFDRHFERGEGPGDEIAGRSTLSDGLQCKKPCYRKSTSLRNVRSFSFPVSSLINDGQVS